VSDLFTFDPEQATHLARVADRIGGHILAFCRERARARAPEFHMDELVAFVQTRLGGAPDSPSRILRALRQAEAIDYLVLNRRDSLYRLLMVDGTPTSPAGPSENAHGP
jgi:hypothetical protein